MPKPRRFLRIGLRTLFLITTAVAVWIGMLAKHARDQRDAIRRIAQLGGTVVYDHESSRALALSAKPIPQREPPGWPWLRTLLGGEYFETVVGVRIIDPFVDDHDLELLSKLRGLTSLTLASDRITDAGLQHLRRLHPLREFTLTHSRVTNVGLQFLTGCPELQSLEIANNRRIDDRALEHIKPLTALTELNLSGTAISLGGVSELTALTDLAILKLNHTAVDDHAISRLARLNRLTTLDLTGCQVTGPGLVALRDALPKCKVVGDIWNLAGLKSLRFRNNGVIWPTLVESQIDSIASLRLKLLDLAGSAVTDADLPPLYALDGIQAIDLRRTLVSPAAAERLERELPGCKCFFDEK